MKGSFYSATDELSLCQDRTTSIFSLIKRNFKKVENRLLKESYMLKFTRQPGGQSVQRLGHP